MKPLINQRLVRLRCVRDKPASQGANYERRALLNPSTGSTGNTGRLNHTGGSTGNTDRLDRTGGSTGNTCRLDRTGGSTGNTGRLNHTGGSTGNTDRLDRTGGSTVNTCRLDHAGGLNATSTNSPMLSQPPRTQIRFSAALRRLSRHPARASSHNPRNPSHG